VVDACSTSGMHAALNEGHLDKETLWMFESFGGFIAARALWDRI